ncbi:SDR family oxidoreductase (plasmid) [Leptospira interrogans serovar Canicola]|uniref:SDR family oxidoreductase n=2 Tax=Leptospira interrogans TaxID=173 RepID=A0AAP9WIZ4_LEPIR|nr:SDR family oxidoreductase [Leptospira interrogans]QOI45244.1 SDR family oxidoreductase [Leptospira interrogans serovar Canicola]QOI53109.1 SDR family oxidoreductase [Leptospira interrogans serovar Bataviae]
MKSELSSVIITGASSGIGEALARHLAYSKKSNIILNGRNKEKLIELKSELSNNVSVEIVAGNLNDHVIIDEIMEIATNCNSIGALVNCAGIGYFESLDNFDLNKFNEVISTNLTSVFKLIQEVVKILTVQNKNSTIVNVSSDADEIPFLNASAYCASKAGLKLMTKSLAMELAPKGIRLCTVSPGRVDTYFNGKKPGMRPGALSAQEVAEVIDFVMHCSQNIEIQEVRLDSMSRFSIS